jgi:hypothetical protein
VVFRSVTHPENRTVSGAKEKHGAGTDRRETRFRNGRRILEERVRPAWTAGRINKIPNQTTGGEGPATGEEVQIAITFNPPILLAAGHYFFRPEVLVTGGDFLYLSAPRPIVSPGTVFSGDLQAWIRNSNLLPDWLHIGTDIIGGATPPTFNMTFSLTGDTIPNAGTPGEARCVGQTVSALAQQFAGINGASLALRYSSIPALQDAIQMYCAP